MLYLTPYFLDVTPDGRLAEFDILDTLESYAARTRAQLIQATRIIALSFSMLDVLAEAKAIYEHPAPLRLRFRNCANALNRSTQQVEKALARSLMCDNPEQPAPNSAKAQAAKTPAARAPAQAAKAPTTQTPAAETRADLTQAEAERLIQQTRAEIDTCRNRLSGLRPAGSPQPAPGAKESAFMAAWDAACNPR